MGADGKSPCNSYSGSSQWRWWRYAAKLESPGLLGSWNDLLSRKYEPVQSGVPQLHAGGKANPCLSMCPVSRTTTSNVQHAGDTPSLVCLAMDIMKSITTLESKFIHCIIVIRSLTLISPG